MTNNLWVKKTDGSSEILTYNKGVKEQSTGTLTERADYRLQALQIGEAALKSAAVTQVRTQGESNSQWVSALMQFWFSFSKLSGHSFLSQSRR